MRILGGLLLFVLLAFVLVGGGQAAMTWWEMSEAVDGAVLDARGADTGWGAGGATRVRSGILRRVASAGVALSEDRLSVSDEQGSLRVRLRWLYPLVVLQDETVVAIPLSINRTYAPRR
jgi:hypothetical protein